MLVPILSDAACKSYFSQFGYQVNTMTQVCAGYKNGGVGSCQGDSGKLKIKQIKTIEAKHFELFY